MVQYPSVLRTAPLRQGSNIKLQSENIIIKQKYDIMKKEYKSPAATALLLEAEPVMTTTSAEQGSANVGNKPVGGNTPDLAGESRGQWGNLW